MHACLAVLGLKNSEPTNILSNLNANVNICNKIAYLPMNATYLHATPIPIIYFNTRSTSISCSIPQNHRSVGSKFTNSDLGCKIGARLSQVHCYPPSPIQPQFQSAAAVALRERTPTTAAAASLLAATVGLLCATKVLGHPVVRCPAQVKKVIGFCDCLHIKLRPVLCSIRFIGFCLLSAGQCFDLDVYLFLFCLFYCFFFLQLWWTRPTDNLCLGCICILGLWLPLFLI